MSEMIREDGRKFDELRPIKIEAGVLEATQKKLYRWPQLRHYLENGTKQFHDKNAFLCNSFHFIGIFALIIYSLVLIFVALTVFDDYPEFIERSGCYFDLVTAFNNVQNAILIHFGRHTSQIFTEDEYKAALPQEVLNENISLNYSLPFVDIERWSDIGIKA